MATTESANIWKAFLRKDFLKPPKEFHRGQNIQEYIKSIEEYCDAIDAKSDATYILINNLDDDVKYELFALPDYNDHSKDYKWIKETLFKLHKNKVTEVSPLLELLKIKQLDSQSITEFASSLRIKAFQMMGHENPDKREQFLVTSFLKGLSNRRLSAAIKSMKPDSLNKAIEMAKREKIEIKKEMRAEDALYAFSDERKEKDMMMENMAKEIMMLKEKIDYLISLQSRKNVNENNNSPRTFRRTNENRTRTFQRNDNLKDICCYNCNSYDGHLARNCKEPCRICNDTSHSSYRCPKRRLRKREHLRVVQQVETESSDNGSCSSIADEYSDQSDQSELYCLQEEKDTTERETTIPEAYVAKQKKMKKSHLKKLREKQSNGKSLEIWTQYINGQGRQPRKHYTETLITKRRPERAANKPIVKAECEGKLLKVFIDSGAECNTIDYDLFCTLQKRNRSLVLHKDYSEIKCASGNVIKSDGFVNLEMKFGKVKSVHPFKVIHNMFPELIVGIKLMKKMKIRVNPALDCIEVGNVSIPFISKVQSEHVYETENEQAPFYGAIRRC